MAFSAAVLDKPGPPAQGGPTHTTLGSVTSITNQENALQTPPQTVGWKYFLNWGFSFQMTLGCVKLTEENMASKVNKEHAQ